MPTEQKDKNGLSAPFVLTGILTLNQVFFGFRFLTNKVWRREEFHRKYFG